MTWIQQDRWITYTRAEQALKSLGDLLDFPSRTRMPCLLITAATGMGKTHIIERFVRDHPVEFDQAEGVSRRRVASLQMPPEPLEKELYEELLLSMGALVPGSAAMGTPRARIRALARESGLRLIIIDEIHAMLAGTFRQQRFSLNALRFLANDLHLPLVCAGTHEAHQALLTDQQLADRFAVFELPNWKDDAAFIQLLNTFVSLLPLRRRSELSSPRIRQRILALTEGITVRICRVLEAAAIAAIAHGTEEITLENLTEELVGRSLVSISDRRRRRGAA